MSWPSCARVRRFRATARPRAFAACPRGVPRATARPASRVCADRSPWRLSISIEEDAADRARHFGRDPHRFRQFRSDEEGLTASLKTRRYKDYDRPVAGIVVALTFRSGRAAIG